MVEQSRDQRILNVPPVVAVLIVLLGLVHALLFLLLTPEQTTEFLLLFAFIPARYDTSLTTDIVWPGGLGADIWTFVTYALIHGDLTHLIFNAVWLLAFGSPVARRFGARRRLIACVRQEGEVEQTASPTPTVPAMRRPGKGHDRQSPSGSRPLRTWIIGFGIRDLGTDGAWIIDA